MRVISKARLRVFWEQYADAKVPLLVWWKVATKATWASIQDVRRTFPQADAVTLKCGLVVTIFNIGGNKYRLIATILYPYHVIYIKFVLTHREYDKDAWKEKLCREHNRREK